MKFRNMDTKKATINTNKKVMHFTKKTHHFFVDIIY